VGLNPSWFYLIFLMHINENDKDALGIPTVWLEIFRDKSFEAFMFLTYPQKYKL